MPRQLNDMFADSLPMDVLTDSEDNGDYNSDEINSDVEVALYGAIHHSYATDGHELTADEDNARTESVSKDSPMAGKQRLQPQTNESQSKTPLNNLFRLLDHKLDVSDDEMDKDFVFNDNTNEIDLIEINDSSDDSDIVVVEDKSLDRKKREKRSVKRNHSSASLSSTPRVQTNISLGNVDNLNETTLSAISAMDQFYNEDNYDSAEEERSFNAMSNNRNDWKIGYSDSFVSTNKSNRYYKRDTWLETALSLRKFQSVIYAVVVVIGSKGVHRFCAPNVSVLLIRQFIARRPKEEENIICCERLIALNECRSQGMSKHMTPMISICVIPSPQPLQALLTPSVPQLLAVLAIQSIVRAVFTEVKIKSIMIITVSIESIVRIAVFTSQKLGGKKSIAH
ncbi:unnamed protein product, partial [Medioppia subpectinata]